MIRRCLTTTMTKTMSLRARAVAAEEVEDAEEEAVEEAVVEGAGAREAKSVSSSKEFSVQVPCKKAKKKR